jgi:hypothetical protein
MADDGTEPVAPPAEAEAAAGAPPAASSSMLRPALTPAAAAAADAPPPLPPPPGFEAEAAGSHAVEAEHAADVAAITAAVTATRVGTSSSSTPRTAAHLPRADAPRARLADAAEEVDEPDQSLGKPDQLNEIPPEAVIEITKELAPGASPYVSAKTFEELNLTPELLLVRCAPGRSAARAGGRQCQTLTLAVASLAFALCFR